MGRVILSLGPVTSVTDFKLPVRLKV
uniref:Uncharacterized protein n=1 Tax=Tetraselmis sp. GSL018 TaxID=582737 RepID=A0A061R777_9CHLO